MKPEIIRKIKQEFKLPGHQIERLVSLAVYSKTLESEELRAMFEEEMRQKTTLDRSVFKARQQKPYLFVEGAEIDIKQFLLERVLVD